MAADGRPASGRRPAGPAAGRRYPGDPGVLVALLLNHVRLAPGEAIWMPAGNLHAYLRGAGVEIMAASDNVLRGGLTPKRVDVPELLRVLRFEVLDEPVLAPGAGGAGGGDLAGAGGRLRAAPGAGWTPAAPVAAGAARAAGGALHRGPVDGGRRGRRGDADPGRRRSARPAGGPLVLGGDGRGVRGLAWAAT